MPGKKIKSLAQPKRDKWGQSTVFAITSEKWGQSENK